MTDVIRQLLFAWALLALCVATHALGIAGAMKRFKLSHGSHFWTWTWTFVKVAGWIVSIHLIEITIWAVFYVWRNAMADLPASLYFSAVTYTTTGYGDLVLPENWRLVGAVEALTGILMCGWSTGFFFAALSRMLETSRAEGGV